MGSLCWRRLFAMRGADVGPWPMGPEPRGPPRSGWGVFAGAVFSRRTGTGMGGTIALHLAVCGPGHKQLAASLANQQVAHLKVPLHLRGLDGSPDVFVGVRWVLVEQQAARGHVATARRGVQRRPAAPRPHDRALVERRVLGPLKQRAAHTSVALPCRFDERQIPAMEHVGTGNRGPWGAHRLQSALACPCRSSERTTSCLPRFAAWTSAPSHPPNLLHATSSTSRGSAMASLNAVQALHAGAPLHAPAEQRMSESSGCGRSARLEEGGGGGISSVYCVHMFIECCRVYCKPPPQPHNSIQSHNGRLAARNPGADRPGGGRAHRHLLALPGDRRRTSSTVGRATCWTPFTGTAPSSGCAERLSRRRVTATCPPRWRGPVRRSMGRGASK